MSESIKGNHNVEPAVGSEQLDVEDHCKTLWALQMLFEDEDLDLPAKLERRLSALETDYTSIIESPPVNVRRDIGARTLEDARQGE